MKKKQRKLLRTNPFSGLAAQSQLRLPAIAKGVASYCKIYVRGPDLAVAAMCSGLSLFFAIMQINGMQNYDTSGRGSFRCPHRLWPNFGSSTKDGASRGLFFSLPPSTDSSLAG